MPVILNSNTLDLWLDLSVDIEQVLIPQINATPATDLLEFFKVSTFVNSIKNDGPDCSLDLQSFTQLKGIGRFFKSNDKYESK